MNLESLSEKVNQSITLWAKDKDKIVVAIDGCAGVGKTTLLKNLVKLNPEIIAVHRDDFLLPREIIKHKLADADDKSKVFELDVCDHKKLEVFINAFRNTSEPCKIDAFDNEGTSGQINIPKVFDFSKKILVVEGVFMFHPKLSISKLWDKRIYLKGDKAKIAERRIDREKKRYGEHYFPEDHPDSYFRHVLRALERYIDLYHPEKVADLVLDVD